MKLGGPCAREWTFWGFMTSAEVQQFVYRVERQYGHKTASWHRITTR